MPKRAKAASKKGGSMASYTGVHAVREMIEKSERERNVSKPIPATKKKRSKISKWVTGAKDAKSE